MLSRPAFLRGHSRALCAHVGVQFLDSQPDSRHRGLSAGELFDCRLAWQAIPDIHQSAGRPLLGESDQFLRVRETLGSRLAFCLLRRGVRGDVVFLVNRLGRHGHLLFSRLRP